MISFRLVRRKFLYGIEHGQLARRRVRVYVLIHTDKTIDKDVYSAKLASTRRADARGGAQSVARTAWHERQRVFEADTLLSEPAGTMDQGGR